MTKPTKPNNEWEKEFDKEIGEIIFEDGNNITDAVKDFISKTIQQQREKYEFTRKEIIEWLHEQNWKCEQLEKLILKK
jgi:hypothetical protein